MPIEAEFCLQVLVVIFAIIEIILVLIYFPLSSFALALSTMRILKSTAKKSSYGIAGVLLFLFVLFLLFLLGASSIKKQPAGLYYALIPLFSFLSGLLWGISMENRIPLEDKLRRILVLQREK